MDLDHEVHADEAPGLPRASGDGPELEKLKLPDLKAPPRQRGWTDVRPLALEHVDGSPAPAGMDRNLVYARRHQEGLPRASGDGPDPQGNLKPVLQAPPRQRGWTRLQRAADHA